MKIRVAVDCREFYRNKMTGIGRFLKNFIRTAADMRPDWEFILFGSQNTEVPFTLPDNARFYTLHDISTQFWEQVLLPKAIKKLKCRLFFSPYYKTCLFSPVPSVITIHDLTHFVFPGYNDSSFLFKMLMRLYAVKSEAIITISINSKRDIVNILGVPVPKVHVINLSVDTDFFKRSNDCLSVIDKFGGPGYILYVGNSNVSKNLNNLVLAYSMLPATVRRERDLVLVGVGDYKSPSVPEGSSCIVVPFVPESELPSIYSAAGMFVFPSNYEGFGLPPLEAMACGCPVVSSNASSLPEVLGDACLYFDPVDPYDMSAKLLELNSNQHLRNRLSACGLERARCFTPIANATGILDIFESVLERQVNYESL